ncbi:MAG: PKD domain-containing protein, partial [Methanocalculaceae archaeon]|nr:PKD domain-containing protein [Methanocalculaceae archaeon]
MLLLMLGLVIGCVGVVSAEDNSTSIEGSGAGDGSGSGSGAVNETTTNPTTEATTAATTTATVSKSDLDVSINANITSGKIPLTVNFTAVVNDSLVKSYKWEVHKDETYKEGRSVIFTYKEVGEYTVTLIVDPKDSSKYNKVEKTVKITATEDVLDASFTASTTSGTAPLTVKFTDTS